ncbi:hypothetical protein GCM10009801_28910 [Streptomyces albiaxialis]|uniref:Uncharacterized protein n=1 Tax=Streptomyces albiaxialis TaxID=329523 RepID=A0ABN2VWN2_9ACTN
MADDRYNWLDEETAERLLRGLPVDAQETRREGHRERNRKDRRGPGALNVPGDAWFEEADRRTAERLASVLDALAAEHTHAETPAHGSTAVELPGEAAALDAFRAARVGVLHSASVGMAGPGGDSGSPSASASSSAPGAPDGGRGGRTRGRRGTPSERRARSVLGGRPLRAGFAVALAGCALGGVAVAAGAGVLPTPFGGKGTPAVSVSPVASPDANRSHGSGEAGADPSEDEDTRDTSGGKPDRDPDGKESASPSTPGDRRSSSGGPGHGGEKGDAPGDGGEHDDRDDEGDRGEGHGSAGSPDKQAVASALCKAYEDGKLSAGDRRKLERAAGGRAVVQKFCAKYDSPGGGPVSGGPGGAVGGNGGSGGNHDSGGGSGGSGGGPGRPGSSGGATGGGEEDGGSSAGSGGEGDSGGSDASGTSGGTGTTGGSAGSPAVSGASEAPGRTVTGATPSR